MFVEPNEMDILARAVLLTAGALLWVVLLVRMVGLRSFSKMTAFDFVATIATGSLLATAATATSWSGFAQVAIAILALMAVQAALSALRKASRTARELLGNTPILLMRDGVFLDDAMRTSRVAREDVMAKLREANVTDLKAVRAVVLENTGDISVLHGGELDPELLQGVRGAAQAPR
ncbi:DUF421 domain-containing protein [Porphyrobacter sp. AAP60]|uniref:DUF421 domain-containing protein n=1 Tax=Porphyrobacter sp. AAP60 TaxID=1523423 RepID=UPI0006B8C35B|nr:YetF domain-containing protein [Porphyrobacter sp. AAP60]KPF64566.1 hypothetical protein IP79_04745 [Porphyrobacter sp. AAP60]